GKAATDSSSFFQDAGFADPPRISELLPRVDTASMEVLSRPLPRMVDDSELVLLLAALDATRAEGAAPVVLPQLGPPHIAGDHPWGELQAPPRAATAPDPVERPRQSGQIPGNPRGRRLLSVSTQPSGASIYFEGSAEPVCQSPCDIQA